MGLFNLSYNHKKFIELCKQEKGQCDRFVKYLVDKSECNRTYIRLFPL